MSYDNYLRSSHWQETKRKKAKRTVKRCSICASFDNIALHHLIYRAPLTDVKLSDLRWLCSECHSCAHELIRTGVIIFPKPDNHHSCFAITKSAVKKHRGFGNLNLFA